MPIRTLIRLADHWFMQKRVTSNKSHILILQTNFHGLVNGEYLAFRDLQLFRKAKAKFIAYKQAGLLDASN